MEIETIELTFLLCITPLFQCLKTSLALLVDLMGIPAMKKGSRHSTNKIEKTGFNLPINEELALCKQ